MTMMNTLDEGSNVSVKSYYPRDVLRNETDGHHLQNPTSSDTLVMYRKWLEGFILLFYTIVFIFGLSSNSVLTYLILTRQFMNKYVFTASISVAHIIVCVVVIPIVIVHCVTSDVRLERPCHVIMCISVGVTSYSMLSTAVRRYLALSDRYRYTDFTYRGKFINLAGIWIVSVAVALPLVNGNDQSMYNIFPSTYFQVMRREHEPVNVKRGTLQYFSSEFQSDPLKLVISTDAVPSTNQNLSQTFAERAHQNTSGSLEPDTMVQKYGASINAMWIYSAVLLWLQVIIPCVLSFGFQVWSYRSILRRPNQTHWRKEINITRQHMFMIVLFAICFVTLMCLNLLDVLRHFIISPFLIRCLQPLAVSLVMYFPVIYYFQNAYIKREFLQWLAQVTGRHMPMNPGAIRTDN